VLICVTNAAFVWQGSSTRVARLEQDPVALRAAHCSICNTGIEFASGQPRLLAFPGCAQLHDDFIVATLRHSHA
jgi:hypothetical protein